MRARDLHKRPTTWDHQEPVDPPLSEQPRRKPATNTLCWGENKGDSCVGRWLNPFQLQQPRWCSKFLAQGSLGEAAVGHLRRAGSDH